MNIITYSNREDKLVYLKQSEKIFDIKINYIIKDNWEGFITKIIEVKEILDNFDDDDIIVFIDAFDVIVNSDMKHLITKFKLYNCDILLGAELNCFPPKFKPTINQIIPPTIKNKYINSGGYMGYVKNIKHMLNWKTKEQIQQICICGGDQSYFMTYFIENYNKVNIKLDIKSLIFQNMHMISWNDIHFIHGRVYNNVFKTHPCFIHFNGGTWQTNEKKNIMHVFIEKIIQSKKNSNTIYNLNEHIQIITRTCFPISQI